METKLTVRIDLDLRDKAHEAAKELEETTLSRYVIKQIERLVREHERCKPKIKKSMAKKNQEPDKPLRKEPSRAAVKRPVEKKPVVIDIGL